jgi:hypothetical protein
VAVATINRVDNSISITPFKIERGHCSGILTGMALGRRLVLASAVCGIAWAYYKSKCKHDHELTISVFDGTAHNRIETLALPQAMECERYVDWFFDACATGDLATAQIWAQMLTLEEICGCDNDALFVASAAGHLAVAQWLWSLGLIPGPREFVVACSNGHLAIAQWIWGPRTRT